VRDQLIAVHDQNAFRSSWVYAQLELYHVEFDELTGSQGVEAILRHWMTRQGHVLLVGRSGSGKTSTLAGVFGGLADMPSDVAPLRIGIALAEDEVVTQAGPFARHVVRQIANSAQQLTPAEQSELERLTANTIRLTGKQRRRGFTLGGNLHVANAQLARDVIDTAPELTLELGAAEAAAALQRLIATFRERGVEPILIFDDADTWTSRTKRNLAPACFETNVRMLTTELDCGFVIAADADYLSLPEYLALQDRLELVLLPRLTAPREGLARILARRLDVMGLDGSVAEIFEPAALDTLAEIYAADPDIRAAMAVAARSVRHALDAPDLGRVPAVAVRAAAQERQAHRGSE
jgi:Cdc6-like AAA superfamily ATPase